MKRILLSIFFLLVSIVPTLAWGPLGHRVVAQVAYSHLNRKAKSQIDAILGKDGVVYWCNYPDEIKSDTILTYTPCWHYQDMNPGMSDDAVKAMLNAKDCKAGNLFQVYQELTEQLSCHADSCMVMGHMLSKEVALKFFIHLSGDIYCPVHLGYSYNEGGNTVIMKWHNEDVKLHRVWDEKLIESRKLSYTEYANWLENRYGQDQAFKHHESLEDVVLKNYHMTTNVYDYQETYDGNAHHYVYHFKDILDVTLYRAGIRLSQMLNQIYR